ncbi:MAG: DUF998 domain-containing protein [Aeromicrobium sp.]
MTRGRWLTLTGWVGIAGPVLFTLAFVGQELFRMEEYSPLAEPVSALAAGPNGWIQHVNFVVLGVLTMIFAVGLHLGLRPTRFGVVGPALFFVTGIANIMGGVFFPLRENAAGVTYDPGGHQQVGMTFFLGSTLALIVISFRVARDPRWRDLRVFMVAVAVALVVGNVLMVRLVIPDDAPLHDWAGLGQRILVVGLLFPARIVLSSRLIRTAREQAVRAT